MIFEDVQFLYVKVIIVPYVAYLIYKSHTREDIGMGNNIRPRHSM